LREHLPIRSRLENLFFAEFAVTTKKFDDPGRFAPSWTGFAPGPALYQRAGVGFVFI
jgi:hypothetical protein